MACTLKPALKYARIRRLEFHRWQKTEFLLPTRLLGKHEKRLSENPIEFHLDFTGQSWPRLGVSGDNLLPMQAHYSRLVTYRSVVRRPGDGSRGMQAAEVRKHKENLRSQAVSQVSLESFTPHFLKVIH